MMAIPNGPDLERLRAANPVGAPPEDLAAHPAAQTLLAYITTTDEEQARTPLGVERAVARRQRRRPHTRALALALVGAVAIGGIAYGAARWSTEDLPAAGTGEDAFVLPETSILPGGYESTRPPLYKNLPTRPSIQFPAGTTYGQAVASYLDARRAGGILPAGARLTDPLPDGVVAQINDVGMRLDPAAPLGYDLDSGIIATPGPDSTRINPAQGALLPRCQLLLGDEVPAADPACPTGSAQVERYREVDGRWVPFDRGRVIPTDPTGPTTLALLDRPLTERDRLPDDIRASIQTTAATLPVNARAGVVNPAAMDQARLAGTALGARVWVVPGSGSTFCMLVAPRQPTYSPYASTCASTRQLATRGAVTLTKTDRRTGTDMWIVVADGYATATIDGGTAQPIRGNLIGISAKPKRQHAVTLNGPAGTRTMRVP